MKKKIICFLLMLIIFVAGFFCSMAYTKINDLFKESMEYSIDSIREKTSSMQIEIPEKAWDLCFFWKTSGPDCQCFLAFSAAREDIIKTIQHLKETTAQEYNNFTVPDPVDNTGKKLNWWTSISASDLETYRGSFYWAGYETRNSRVYIYRFTQ